MIGLQLIIKVSTRTFSGRNLHKRLIFNTLSSTARGEEVERRGDGNTVNQEVGGSRVFLYL